MRRPTALFESWRGRYADSPRAISARLSELHPEVRQTWVTDGKAQLPDGVDSVRRHSPGHFRKLGSSTFVVSNDIVTRWPLHRSATRYLQTWHGTPLKRIGHDETMPAYDHAAHMRRVDRDVRRWSALLSTGAECTELFRSAFGFAGSVLETGLPRNDVLRSTRSDEVRDSTRRSLALSEGDTAVLWAPTWRDDLTTPDGGFAPPGGLDIGEFLDATPPEVKLLVRMHSVVTAGQTPTGGDRVLDVSDHPDISELYLASDVLVSDYSSAVFDYAVLGRPILLLAYDLQDYSDRVRGLYFDYRDWAPGPVATDTAGLVEDLSSLIAHGPSAEDRTRLDDFRRRFCAHEDGSATDRVIESFFEPHLGR